MSTLFTARRLQLLLAFFLIYFIWGSTYLAIHFAIETIPPMLMAGARFTLAGVLMFVILRLRGEAVPELQQWLKLWVVGTFLFLGGNGLVAWAQQWVNSGLAALLVSTLPVWLILLDWLWAKGPRPTWMAICGIVLGIIGMVVLVDPLQLVSSDIYLPGAAMLLLASMLWACGSIYSKKFRQPRSIFMSAACQMIGGGVSLLLVSVLLGEYKHFDLGAVSITSLTAFCYLLVFGSMVAISSYVWLLQNATASSVSTYAFVNPAVAIFLGWILADETLTPQILSGAAIILTGVFLVIMAPRKKQPV